MELWMLRLLSFTSFLGLWIACAFGFDDWGLAWAADGESATAAGSEAGKTLIGAKYDLTLFDTPFNARYAEAFPSMRQSLGITQTLTHGLNGTIGYAWNLESDSFWWNLAGRVVILGAGIAVSTVPGFDGWMHEEWHRAVMTQNSIKSYNEINDWPNTRTSGGGIAVSGMRDADMARLKSENHPDFIRLMSAGMEAQRELVLQLEKDAFFDRTRSPNTAQLWLSNLNTIAYVQTCASGGGADFNEARESESETEKDFTGLDCNSWSYDLHRKDEPYAARGLKKDGTIQRYRKTSDLSDEERNFLKKHLALSYLGLVDPFLFLLRSYAKNDWPIALRMMHQLTSFGGDTALAFFYRGDASVSPLKIYSALHVYSNKSHVFPGLEAEILDYPAAVLLDGVPDYVTVGARALIWTQPERLDFRTSESEWGGLGGLNVAAAMRTWAIPYVFLEGKSRGWVAGVVDQQSSWLAGVGIRGYY
jgi:hypothetical protein